MMGIAIKYEIQSCPQLSLEDPIRQFNVISLRIIIMIILKTGTQSVRI